MAAGSRNVFWIITGAGSYLRVLAEKMLWLKERSGARFTIGFSRWGYEVARIYGALPLLRRVAGGGYMEEWLIGEQGFYYVGRLNMGKYGLVIIAPASGNTVAKMVHGIADTLPTLAFAEAGKSGVPVIVLSSDIPGPDGYAVSEAPCIVDRDRCRCIEERGYCPAMDICPVNAIVLVDGKPRIDHSRCIGCEKCVEACIADAITCWRKIWVRPREIDVTNIDRLRGFKNTYVVSSPDELLSTASRILGG